MAIVNQTTNSSVNLPSSDVYSALKATGQITMEDINRQLYTNAFIDPLVKQASNISTPQVATPSFDNVALTDQQTQFYQLNAQNLATQSQIQLNELANQQKGIISSIAQGAQDRAITSGMLTGELGMIPTQSTRAVSFVGDAQARAQSQILDATNTFQNTLLKTKAQSDATQIELLGKAMETQQVNEQQAFAKDQYMTEVTGLLYQNGKETNIRTMQAQQFDYNKQASERQFQADLLSNGLQVNPNTGLVEINPNSRQYAENEVAKKQAQTQLDIINQWSGNNSQYTLTPDEQNIFNQKDANGNAVQVDINNPNYKSAIDKIDKTQKKYGAGAYIYYGLGLDGEKYTVKPQDDVVVGLTQKGLFLDAGFNNPEYQQTIANAGLTEAELKNTPDKVMQKYLAEQIMNGDASKNINKVLANNNDGKKTILLLSNLDQKGNRSYRGYEVDMSNLSNEQKQSLTNELLQINPNTPDALNKVTLVLNDAKSKYGDAYNFSDITTADFLEKYSYSGEYSNSANNKMTFGSLDNRQLVSALLAGSTGMAMTEGGIIFNKSDIDSNTGAMNFNTAMNVYQNQLKSIVSLGFGGTNTNPNPATLNNSAQLDNFINLYRQGDITLGTDDQNKLKAAGFKVENNKVDIPGSNLGKMITELNSIYKNFKSQGDSVSANEQLIGVIYGILGKAGTNLGASKEDARGIARIIVRLNQDDGKIATIKR